MRKLGVVGLLTLTVALSACGTTSQNAPAPRASTAVAPQFVPGEVLVQLESGLSAQSLGALEARLGVQTLERLAVTDGAPLYRARVADGRSVEQAVRDLSGSANVRFAEPNWIYTTQATATDPYYTNGSLWGMGGNFGTNAASAWANGHTGSAGVYVGVIDEGIQFTHPDLQGQVWTNPYDPVDGRDNDGNGLVDDTHGWDFANGDNTIYDGGSRGNLDDHGTHVSGTIGAKANNGQGVVGMNWNVTLISGKFLGRNGGTTANAIKAVDYFTDLKTRHGLNIVALNNSWGGGGFSQGLLDAVVRAAKQNILFIAAAGNSGTNNDATASYPSNYDTTAGAGYDSVIAVAAIDKNGGLASFSQYGAKTVDIGAPGVDVWSTTAANTYESYNGTSMATPHVTGAAALYASTHAGAGAKQIRDAILGAAVATPSLQGKTVTGGRLNVGGF